MWSAIEGAFKWRIYIESITVGLLMHVIMSLKLQIPPYSNAVRNT